MKVSRDHVCDKSKIIKDFTNKKITFFEARLKIKQIQRDAQKGRKYQYSTQNTFF